MWKRFCPVIVFGHLNARTFGSLKTSEDFGKVFERMENCLGSDRMRRFHSHFSKIEYTEKGGEKRHLTFADTVFGPDFEPLAEWIVRKNCSPTVICESAEHRRKMRWRSAGIMKAFWIRQGRTENEKTAFGHSWPQYQSDRDS